MLFEFLEENRIEILALAEEKTLKLAGTLSSSEELRRGLPVFFEHLILSLQKSNCEISENKMVAGAADHGRELLHLHYTLSHVVHAYGAMCQAVTELAHRRKANISSKEFNILNMCLDIAIAAAVSEFQFRSVQVSEEKEVQHLGLLVHELRNALSSATVAAEMIKQGLVGASGSTAKVLHENLARMRDLIDRSISEVRMRTDPEVHIEKFALSVLVDQIFLTAKSEVHERAQTLTNEIKSEIELETDRQLLLSAIANLTQNALKFTKHGGHIVLRSGGAGENVIIEIEDQCGGIPSQVVENLFKPFASGGFDQSGLGLGLTVVQRAVYLLQGKVTVRNSPGIGCAFQIEIPRKIIRISPQRVVSGESSVQPRHK